MNSPLPLTDLHELLRRMDPVLHLGQYVFASVQYPGAIPAELLVATFREAEGTTIILGREAAERLGVTFSYVAAWITLTVPSSLHAVGLTAAVSTALARHGINCNVVAGYHHDHLFVDADDGQRAVEVLRALAGTIAPAAPAA